MLVDIIIFAIMSYFYVPLENVDDDDGSSKESIQNSISLEPITADDEISTKKLSS